MGELMLPFDSTTVGTKGMFDFNASFHALTQQNYF